MHAMLCLWLVFALMLYIVEPLFLHRRMKRPANPARNFARMEWMHRLLFALALVTIFGAVAGSHGLIRRKRLINLPSCQEISRSDLLTVPSRPHCRTNSPIQLTFEET